MKWSPMKEITEKPHLKWGFRILRHEPFPDYFVIFIALNYYTESHGIV